MVYLKIQWQLSKSTITPSFSFKAPRLLLSYLKSACPRVKIFRLHSELLADRLPFSNFTFQKFDW